MPQAAGPLGVEVEVGAPHLQALREVSAQAWTQVLLLLLLLWVTAAAPAAAGAPAVLGL
jgi:hypothetical protein